MCLASDKIKFCTCATPSVGRLKHYWILHRFIKGKNQMVIGDPVLPYHLNPETENINRQLLLARINEPDAFDIDLQPKEGDRLQISFQCETISKEYIHYGFSFTGGKWVEQSYDGLTWMWHHKEDAFGKLKNALKRKE